MAIRGDGGSMDEARKRSDGSRLARFSGGLVIVALVTVGGCSLPDGPGQLMVDPGHYSAFHCDQLATQATALAAREKELRGLMGKASDGGGGSSAIGSIAYRPDYEAVLSDQKLVQREMVDKNCPVKPTFQSDQDIR